MASVTSTISDAQINFAGVFAYASTIPGIVVCFVVLVAYGVVAVIPDARKCLDRVSFRLLVYSLVFNVFYGIAFAATPSAPGRGCDVGAFFVNFTLFLSTFFTTCIAINLELVLIHGVNGKKMEKYYVIGTILLSLALNVPTAALKQFGWNDTTATCWYSNASDGLRLRWIIGTQSFWMTLAATIETVCSAVVLFWLFQFKMRIRSFMDAARSSSSHSTEPAGSSGEKSSSRGGVATKTTTTKSSGKPLRSSAPSSSTISEDPRFKKIIIRIVMYPIVSLTMNYGTVVLDLNSSIVGVNTEYDYRLLVLDLTLYGLRTLAYGILAASDPSFTNAARVLYKSLVKEGQVTDKTRPLTKMGFKRGVATTTGRSSDGGVDTSRTGIVTSTSTTGGGGGGVGGEGEEEDVEAQLHSFSPVGADGGTTSQRGSGDGEETGRPHQVVVLGGDTKSDELVELERQI